MQNKADVLQENGNVCVFVCNCIPAELPFDDSG